MEAGTLAMLALGLVSLVAGGEMLVRGASGLAARLGMSPLIVGLTVVAFATSAPELAVTLKSVLSGSPDIAIGNVVGSNVANVLLIVGVAAAMGTVVVKSQMVRFDVPVMIGFGVLALLFSLGGTITTAEGIVLVSLLVAYLVMTIRMSRRMDVEVAEGLEVAAPASTSVAVNSLQFLIGLAGLVIGAQLLVDGAITIATALNMPEIVIGLTIVAVGTSLPELTTTVVAAIRGQRDLAVGNAVGSNIFNIGAVLGISSIVASPGVPVSQAAVRFDLPVMIAVSFLLLPVVYTGFSIRRWEGLLFLGLYACYTLYLLLNATEHSALPAFSRVMLFFVLPTVALSLGVFVGYDAGLRRGREDQRAYDAEQRV